MFEFIGNISDIAGAIGAVISSAGVLRLLWLKRLEGEEVDTVTFWVRGRLIFLLMYAKIRCFN